MSHPFNAHLTYACSTHKAAPDTQCATCSRIARERLIVFKLVSTILDAGDTVGVSDGEEITVPESTDAAEILKAMCTTDLDVLMVYAPGEGDRSTRRMGSITLIYGNDIDLISDWSWRRTNDEFETQKRSDDMSALVQVASDFAETLI